MVYSIILETVPTAIVSFLITQIMDKENSIILNIVLFYLYIISTFFLIRAGTTDPGIFERQQVNYENEFNNIFRKFFRK